jgi:hypothetical protein
MAAKATFALKAGVWLRRVRFVIFTPDSPREILAAVRQKIQLAYCPDSRSHLYNHPELRRNDVQPL